MKDYIQEFKKQRVRKNMVIIISSLAFAFVINGFLFWTNVWNKLQTSVKNYNNENVEIKSDLYLSKMWTGSDIIELKAWNKMLEVDELSFSVLSDVDGIKINDIFSENKNIEIIKTSNEPGVYTVIVKFSQKADINMWDSIIKLVYTKLKNDKTSINLISTKFKSKWVSYELSSSWVEF